MTEFADLSSGNLGAAGSVAPMPAGFEQANPVTSEDKLIRGFIFACTDDTQDECLKRLLFATEKSYGPVVIRIRTGDLLFLNNVDTDTMYGVFKAISDGGFKVKPSAFKGRYPYQVEVQSFGGVKEVVGAKKLLNRLGATRNTPLFRTRLAEFLGTFAQASLSLDSPDGTNKGILELEEKVRNSKAPIDIEDEIPHIEATTFWDFPKQSYGLTPKGNNKYAGVTPALIIYNMVWRYTDPGDLVVDPMCGSGKKYKHCCGK